MFDSKLNEAKQARNMEGGKIISDINLFHFAEPKNDSRFVRFK